jgi:hypothetical protein
MGASRGCYPRSAIISAGASLIRLLRRSLFLNNDKGVGGGVYLWETREAAENCYFTWGESVRRGSGGNEPEIAWFETGVVVNNESHQN